MGQRAEELRADIARTRDDMSDTIDAMGDRISPKQMARRRTRALGQWTSSLRRTVMGTVSDTAGQARDQVGQVGDRLSGAAGQARQGPELITRQTQGNPLAAGLVAFGDGSFSDRSFRLQLPSSKRPRPSPIAPSRRWKVLSRPPRMSPTESVSRPKRRVAKWHGGPRGWRASQRAGAICVTSPLASIHRN